MSSLEGGVLTGIRFQAKPTSEQAQVLSQWMGCAKTVWNAKCDEDRYLRGFAKRYLPIGTCYTADQKYSCYKDRLLTPWLFNCPSQVLRNSAVNWFNTHHKFLKGQCGRPRRKKRSYQGSVHLTRELFDLSKDPVSKQWTLTLGTVTYPVGKLWVRFHGEFKSPNSIYVKKTHQRWTVSFCYEDEVESSYTREAHFKALKTDTVKTLDQVVVGIDRGVVRPVQCGGQPYNFSLTQGKKAHGREKHLRKLQRKMARQTSDSHRQKKTLTRIARKKQQNANSRDNFCHQTSRKIVDSQKTVFVFEKLNTKNMTRSAKGTLTSPGKNVKQKAGLNRSILGIGWYKLQLYTEYKAKRAGKAVFYINPKGTSQECAQCGHTHPGNRESQADFRCLQCHHTDNADHNAAIVIKQRAIALIKNSGTELSDKGVLTPGSDIGRRAVCKTTTSKRKSPRAKKRQQKTIKHAA